MDDTVGWPLIKRPQHIPAHDGNPNHAPVPARRFHDGGQPYRSHMHSTAPARSLMRGGDGSSVVFSPFFSAMVFITIGSDKPYKSYRYRTTYQRSSSNKRKQARKHTTDNVSTSLSLADSGHVRFGSFLSHDSSQSITTVPNDSTSP